MGKAGGFGRVGSLDEIRMEKIGLAYLITYAYVEGVQLTGNMGASLPELLIRRTQLNYEIESWLSPYIESTSPYWEKAEEIKKILTVEAARVPRLQTAYVQKLAEWNRLLMREEANINLLLTKTAAARI